MKTILGLLWQLFKLDKDVSERMQCVGKVTGNVIAAAEGQLHAATACSFTTAVILLLLIVLLLAS